MTKKTPRWVFHSVSAFCLYIGFISGIQGAHHLPASGTEYDFELDLVPNGVYNMWWSFDDKEITIEVKAQTTGYVGFGLSPSGSMAGADIVIGGVDGNLVSFNVSLHKNQHHSLTSALSGMMVM